MELGLAGDLVVRQDHEVEDANLYRPDGQGEPKTPSIVNVVGPDG